MVTSLQDGKPHSADAWFQVADGIVETFPYDPHLWQARSDIRRRVMEAIARQNPADTGGSH